MFRVWNHFVGSLFSRQAIFAYRSGSAVTTAIVLLWFVSNNNWPEPSVLTADRSGSEILIDMSVRVALPVWIRRPPRSGRDDLGISAVGFDEFCEPVQAGSHVPLKDPHEK